MGPGYTAPMVMHHTRILQPERVTGKWQPTEDELLKQVWQHACPTMACGRASCGVHAWQRP